MQDQLYKLAVNVSNLSNMNPSQPAGSSKLFFGYENDEGTAWLDYSEGITGTTTGNYTYYVVPKTNRGNIFLGINNGGGGYFECEIGSVTVKHIVAAFQPMYSSVLSTVTDYYAFGSPMPGRNFNSPNYRYGFNKMEKDDEIKGNGNSYDFGARIYDSRLGRWLSLNPLQAKYPGESPYSFAGNSPIKFVDKDGRDYGVYVNHNDHTIIIRATLYTTKDDQVSATNAAMHWNSQNGKFEYKVGDGDNAIYYDVKFEVDVNVSNTDTERNQKFNDANCVEANRFDVQENLLYWGGTSPINGGGDNNVVVKEGSDYRSTAAHELGHVFGLGHWLSGLMKNGSDRKPEETKITRGMVSKILSRVGIGQSNEHGDDSQKKPPVNPAKSETTTVGEAPKEFDSGCLEECTR